MGRKKKKPSAKRRRKASELMIEIVKYLLATISAVLIEHYIAVLLNW